MEYITLSFIKKWTIQTHKFFGCFKNASDLANLLANLQNQTLKLFAINGGFVLDLRPVIVDRICRIPEEVSDFITVLDTKPDQCENSKFGVEQLPFP